MVKKYFLPVIFILCQILFSAHLLYADFIPVHPKSVKIDQRNLTINGMETQTTRYESDASVSDVLQFYSDSLQRLGWKINYQSEKQIPNLLVLSNAQNERINLDIYPQESGAKCIIVLTQSKGNMEPPDENKDSKGKEPLWFIRYPNSIKQSVVEWEEGQTLVYVAKQKDMGPVIDFYRREFMSSGWSLQGEKRAAPKNILDNSAFLPDNISKEQLEAVKTQIEEQANLIFLKGSSLLLLSISKAKDRITTTVNYFPRYKRKI